MKLSSETRKEIAEAVGSMEKRFGINCLVVRNKYRISFVPKEIPFSLIMLPQNGDSEEAFKIKVEAAAAEHHNSLPSLRKWHYHLSCLYDSRPWFSRFADQKERFPLKDMAVGSDFISPVAYGRKQMARLRKEAEDFFGEGIIEFWKKEAIRQLREKRKKFKDLFRQEVAYGKERKKLLNKYELAEMKEFVLHLSKKCQEEKTSFVVALDGSGRPIGKALEWYGVCCPVICLDPHHIRFLDFKDPDNVSWVLGALKKEFPQIYTALSENPRSVFFIDDQTGYGSTGEKLRLLVRLFSKNGNGNSLLRYAVMTSYRGDNTPSWLRRREIQGLQIAPEKSLRAIEAPTPQSDKFYGRLKKIVAGW